MNLRNKTIEFTSIWKGLHFCPFKNRPATVVMTSMGPALQPDNPPTFDFENYRFLTIDPEVAKAMVEHEFFEFKRGWFLDSDCLPKDLGDLYQELNTESRRKLLLILIAGGTKEEAFASVAKDTKGPGKHIPGSMIDELELHCPAPGCRAKIKGADSASFLKQHLKVVHPNWGKE